MSDARLQFTNLMNGAESDEKIATLVLRRGVPAALVMPPVEGYNPEVDSPTYSDAREVADEFEEASNEELMAQFIESLPDGPSMFHAFLTASFMEVEEETEEESEEDESGEEDVASEEEVSEEEEVAEESDEETEEE